VSLFLGVSSNASEAKSNARLDDIVESNSAIDDISLEVSETEKNDRSVITVDVSLVNDASVGIEIIDELDNNSVVEGLCGTIVHKKWGDRRYTASYTYKANNQATPVKAYNRIGYTISKTKTLSKRYITIASLNEGEVYTSGTQDYAVCTNAYCDNWYQKKNDSNMPYIRSVGHYNYHDYDWRDIGKYYSMQTLRCTVYAYATVYKWTSDGADMNQHLTGKAGYHS
jgi:hypothetical protein